MPTYIAMLRGINVSGQKKMKMDRLRESFEALGFAQVRTYVQSGNVIFHATRSSLTDLSRKAEERIRSDFGFSVSVISRTSGEISKTIQGNPFLKKPGIDSSKLYVTFLSQVPMPAVLKKLDTWTAEPDEFRYCGREIYLYCPNGYGRTKLSNNAFERVLSVAATTRNWKTVNKLHEISLERG
jgi:uncharacterized protein (DUF1697 family)